KAALLPRAAERKTPIAFDPVPSQVGDFESFAGHRFHRVSEDGFDSSDVDGHAQEVMSMTRVGSRIAAACTSPGCTRRKSFADRRRRTRIGQNRRLGSL